MELEAEIRECFAALEKECYRQLKSTGTKYPTYAINFNGSYGIAIPCSENVMIKEDFANCQIRTGYLHLQTGRTYALILECFYEEYRNEFASLCLQVAEVDDDGKHREDLLKDPLAWWNRWKNLIGNGIVDKKVYNVIAEMSVFAEKYAEDKSAVWTAGQFGTYDIELNNSAYEVKSTVLKYGSTVTISSQFQLDRVSELTLCFVRMEQSKLGISINDMVKKITDEGYSKEDLEKQLNVFGLEYGKSVRNEKYRILEEREYAVDDDFPKITQSSFVGNKIPEGITKITYDVDLESVKYKKIQR